MSATDEWVWGWDSTPGIVSVHAGLNGRAQVWRRDPATDVLTLEEDRFRPWLLLAHLDDLRRAPSIVVQDLEGPGALRHLVSTDDGRTLIDDLLRAASERLGTPLRKPSELTGVEPGTMLALSPDEQYLVQTGRTYFKDLSFDQIHRLQFDLETTGFSPERDKIFMVSIRYHTGETEVIDVGTLSDATESDLIRRLVARIQEADPDVIENHNLQGFDLPFLYGRAQVLGVPLPLGRAGRELHKRGRFVAPGRELIDTLDAVWRYDFATRELPGHGLKAVARHLGVAPADREYIPGAEIYKTYCVDPDRVRRYATHDVEEVAAISRLLSGAAYALARMAPRRYERLADAGPATGVIDPLLVRAYMRAGQALPAHETGDDTPHSGAALHLFAAGVAHRIVKADVASLYPSLMRAYRIGPSRDRLGALLAIVDRLVERRLDEKARARAAAPGSTEQHTHDATSAALKIVVNAAYGYMGAVGLTRFSDVRAANEVTRRGRELLDSMCREFAARGVTLIEADTDGVYFSVPETWSEADERRVVAEVATLLPPLVQLEFAGRYAAMLSHEPKNYALLGYDGSLLLKGVAFRSSRSEPFGEAFLRSAIKHVLEGDVPGVRERYLRTVALLRLRKLSTYDVSSKVRLTKSPAVYAQSRTQRRELPYEALLGAGETHWREGDRVRVYRKANGEGGLAGRPTEAASDDEPDTDPRDYDIEYYVRLLRTTFAERLARAFTGEDFATVFADPDQLSLFAAPLESIRPVLMIMP
ncbi:MAG TPA: ribonuclease H-like domain-containing protein [Gemmatimonadaceae bacterium]|nr:ribonuclease H-like domain-containing protein [Gemmatimonadaceae bacterium]